MGKKIVIAYSVVAYTVCMLLTFINRPSSVAIILFPLVANALYGSRLLPSVPRLKDIPVMKNLVVAVSWAITTTLLPASHMIDKMSTVALILYFILVKGFVNTVLYDMRDVKGDEKNGIRIMPILIGRKRTAQILLAINSTLLPIIMFFNGGARLVARLLVLNGFVCVLYFSDNINAVALDFFVDGEWMLTCIVYL